MMKKDKQLHTHERCAAEQNRDMHIYVNAKTGAEQICNTYSVIHLLHTVTVNMFTEVVAQGIHPTIFETASFYCLKHCDITLSEAARSGEVHTT